jgi:hypothetical protein
MRLKKASPRNDGSGNCDSFSITWKKSKNDCRIENWWFGKFGNVSSGLESEESFQNFPIRENGTENVDSKDERGITNKKSGIFGD